MNRVNDQCRVRFRWTSAGAEDVEIVDYLRRIPCEGSSPHGCLRATYTPDKLPSMLVRNGEPERHPEPTNVDLLALRQSRFALLDLLE